MFEPTVDEVREVHARARERIAIRVEAKLPALDHDQTVAHALNALAAEKAQVVYVHWRGLLWHRWHRRVARLVERKLGRPFRFTSISGHAVRARWLEVLGRFVRRDVDCRFGLGQPVSLVHVRQAYRDERPAS